MNVRVVAQKEFTEKQIKDFQNRDDKTKEQKIKAWHMMQEYNMRSLRGDFDTY